MKRAVLLLIAMSLLASAAAAISTNELGRNPVMHGSLIAFEAIESETGDLNNDGDSDDTIIRFYDTRSASVKTIGVGEHPSIFAGVIVFHSSEAMAGLDLNDDGDQEDTLILYYDSNEDRLVSTKLEGVHPNIAGKQIAFSSKNEIKYYSIERKQVKNTKAFGDYPSISGSVIFFETDEAKLNEDLNRDGVLNDVVIRYYEIPTISTVNTGLVGEKPFVNSKGLAVFSSLEALAGQDLNNDGDFEDEILFLHDSSTGQGINTRITGSQPSITDTSVTFVKNNAIASYSLITNTHAVSSLQGTHPVRFRDIIAFSSHEKLSGDLNSDGDTDDVVVRYVQGDDEDKDAMLVFEDNCPTTPNPNQEDTDSDGIGDLCDTKDDTVRAPQPVKKTVSDSAERKPLPSSVLPEKKEKKKSIWPWVIIILLLVFGIIAAWFLLPDEKPKKKLPSKIKVKKPGLRKV